VVEFTTLPDPELYYPFESSGGRTVLTDDTGNRPFSNTDNFASAASGKEDNLGQATNPAAVSQIWMATAGGAVALGITKTIVSIWVNWPTGASAAATGLLGSCWSGAYGTYTWYVRLPRPVADTSWHLLTFYCVQTGSLYTLRRSVDAGAFADATGFAPAYAGIMCPCILLNPGGAASIQVDELAFHVLGAAVTEEVAGQYATTLYNGGAGIFWRAGTGWYQP